jgi:Subtilase family
MAELTRSGWTHPGWYQDEEIVDEFVVASPYAEDVVQYLDTEYGLKCDRTDSKAPLNLSLIRVANLHTAEKKLTEDADATAGADGRRDRPVIPRAVRQPSKPGNVTALDNVMFLLRYHYAGQYGGWVPPMGKNRTLHNVNGVPHLDPGDVSYPVPVDGPGPQSHAPAAAGAGVRVGIFDTKLYPHPDLAGSYLARNVDLLNPEPERPPRYAAAHATFIAGLVKAQAPGVEMVVRQALSDRHASANVWDLARRMVEFRQAGVRILNLSLGCYTEDGEPPMVLEHAVRLLMPDVVVVAAAGNHGIATEDRVRRKGVTPQSAFWPAALEDVIAVGASAEGNPSQLAAYSPRLPWVGLVDQGEDVVSTFPRETVMVPTPTARDLRKFKDQPVSFKDGYARWSGTSFAAATVTGRLAALMKPDVSNQDAVDKLRYLAGRGSDSTLRVYR